MPVTHIKKRRGEIVEFDPGRIEYVMSKAFSEKGYAEDLVLLSEIRRALVDRMEAEFEDRIPTVENVQDYVEQELAARGFFDVAKAYIIYRYEHEKIREEKKKDLLQRIEKNDLYVVKRDGKKETFSLQKLQKTLSHFVYGYEREINVDAVTKQCRAELYDGISTADIYRSLVMTVRSFIEHDPAYAKVAARLLLNQNYQDVIGIQILDHAQLDAQYRRAFIENMRRGVEIGRIDPRLLAFDLETLSRALVIERDDLFLYMGLQTLHDRYFIADYNAKRVLETPQAFWMRTAMGMAINEKENRIEHTMKFYDVMSKLLYTPSTPTLFHSGTPKPQLSSCYLNTVGDSLDSIFKSYSDNSQLSKWSGGIGTDWTNIRGTGAYIQGTGVESQGVIPFLKIANDVTVAINRSGRRRGAACVYLETWHYDIEDFLELRKNTGDERRRTHDMDTANWIPDLFIKRVREDKDWTLFSPDETPELHHSYGQRFEQKYQEYEAMAQEGKIRLFKIVKAKDLWKKMLAMLFETGHPWITFKDACNVRSPQDHVGVVHNSNLCTEITLNTSEDETAVCNLGSLNFAKFITNGKLDIELIKETVTIAMRMLDNVIDINFYPTEDARRSNMRHRPVGLGIRGFQDALYMLGINFDSEGCVKFADESMEVVSYYTLLASSNLARERGTYQSYRGSKWDRGILPQDTLDLLAQERGVAIDVTRGGKMDWAPVRESIKKYGMRNSNCLAVAPTATTANIVGCIPTIEPIYKNIYVKSNQAGDFIVVNPYLVDDLKKIGMWDYEMLGKIKYFDGSIAQITEIPESLREKYKEVFEIDGRWLIRSAAYRSKWIDQSQSLNIYFRGSSGKDLSDLYMYAWDLGLKTTYYLRTLAISQVEKSTVNTSDYGVTHKRTVVITESVATPEVRISSVGAMASSPTTSSEDYIPTPELKVCSIDDPSCESCQG